jgi:hypothetical protein
MASFLLVQAVWLSSGPQYFTELLYYASLAVARIDVVTEILTIEIAL